MSLIDDVQTSDRDGCAFVFSGGDHVKRTGIAGGLRAHIRVVPGTLNNHLEVNAFGADVDALMVEVAVMFDRCHHDQEQGITLATIRAMAEAVTDPDFKPDEPAGDDS